MYFLLPSLLCPLDRLSPTLLSPSLLTSPHLPLFLPPASLSPTLSPPPHRQCLLSPLLSSTFYFSLLSLVPLSSPCLLTHIHTLSSPLTILTFWKHCYTYHEVTPILSALITIHFSSQLTENSAVKPIDTRLHLICFLQSLSS